jgi:hypothetical protein
MPKPFEELEFINNLLNSIQIHYWLDFGCLLKWYRDKQLDESDIDFGILLQDYDKVKTIIETNKHHFEMVHYRDKEISIRLNGIKFDFICFVKKQQDLYFYAYKQNPYCSNKWNYEWRGKFPYTVYFPLRVMTINTMCVPVPNDIETKIRMQYGEDWNVPKPEIVCWTYELNQVKDINYNPIAVIMTTIERDEILFKVLPSYLKYPVKLYLLDQGKHTKEKDEYYDELRSQGHFVEYATDIGLSAARNYLINQGEEEYVLVTEDDIELTSNPYSLFNRFVNNNLGILGGLLIRNGKEQHYEYALDYANGVLTYKKSDNIDLCLNFFLAKRRVFNDIQYDNNLKLVEHTDFALRFKELNKWKVEYCRDFTGIHHGFKPENYMTYRKRAEQYVEQFKQKWGIHTIIKDDDENYKTDLTVFVLTHDNEPNYEKCLEALNNQTIRFKIDIIKNYHPMSVAFQEMLNRCTTQYYVQVDSDMIVNKDGIEILYNSILQSNEKECMVCYKLHDNHLNKAIDGIKIYKYDIFKNYPYNNVMSCEMEQLNRLEHDGYSYVRKSDVVGLHCPIWNKETIFERYFNYMEKLKKFQSPNYSNLLKKLLTIFLKETTKNNFYGLIGALTSAVIPEQKTDEKDYTTPLLAQFYLIDKTFDDFQFSDTVIAIPEIIIPEPEQEKPLVLQLAGIPCANRPYDINCLINNYSTKYKSRHILGGQYSKTHEDIPYREFPYDLLLKNDRDKIMLLLEEAKILHIHHRIDNMLLRMIPKNKKIIYTVSNLGSSLNLYNTPENAKYSEHVKKISDIITVTDQPMQKNAYNYLTTRTLPLVKYLFNQNIEKNNTKPIIVFAPTNRRLDDFTSKGYFRVLGTIYKLKLSGFEFDFDLIEGIPYTENLKRKQVADIIIDDIVNEEFHNTSIEGACYGAVVLTNYTDEKYPFFKTTLNQLEERIINFLKHPEMLKQAQKEMIDWVSVHYTPEKILKPFEDIYDEILSDSFKKETIETTHVVTLSPIEILRLLKKNNIRFYLANYSCLELVINKKLISDTLCIGVYDAHDIEKIKTIYNLPNLNIVRESVKTTKQFNIGDMTVTVPMPVIKYLEKTFHKPWRELSNG